MGASTPEWTQEMDHLRFYESIVEPSTVRLGLFGIAHDISFDRRNFVVSHQVSKNVFTTFDTRLSRYLSAVRGEGLPHGTVETRIRDVATGRSWTPYPPRYSPSTPAALAMAVKLALGSSSQMNVHIGAWVSQDGGLDHERTIAADTVAALEQALHICGRIGSADFLEISGDLDRVLVRPAGSGMDMIVMDLRRGTVSVPGAEGGGRGHQGPLFGFADTVRDVPDVAAYVARARHAVATAKEEAIHAFRASSEERIIQFSQALGRRPLTGYRMEAASSLVARLQAGLGMSLPGLNEAAQMTALDWAALMRGEEPAGPALGFEDEETPAAQPRLVG